MNVYSNILDGTYRYTLAERLALDLNSYPPAIMPKYDDDPLPWVFARCDWRGYLPKDIPYTSTPITWKPWKAKNVYYNVNTDNWETLMRRRSHWHNPCAKFEVYFYEDSSSILFDALNLEWIAWDYGAENGKEYLII